ncbi:MAG: NAD(+) synthase [Oscillospiraceae bacterium]|nr:NAD(+) synthase [Oscillospiraceae bacterium]
MEHGFVRLAACIPKVTIADCEQNLREIKTLIDRAEAERVDVLVFPARSLTGATCGDLFYQSTLLTAAERALAALCAYTATIRPLVVVGLPVLVGHRLFDCAAFISRGKLLGIVPTEPGDFDEITLADETVPFGADLRFLCREHPALALGAGAMVQAELAAEPEQLGSAEARRQRLAHDSARNIAAIVYAGAGTGESTTDAVFSGHGLIAEHGHIHAETARFQPDSRLVYSDIDLELLQAERLHAAYADDNTVRTVPFSLPPITRPLARAVSAAPYLPPGSLDMHCREAFTIQTAALWQRFEASGCKTAVIGVSGGLDSTLALLVTAATFAAMGRDKADILAVTMPGFGTTDRTHTNARSLMNALGVTCREISIVKACEQHFADIGHDPQVQDITYENTQARARTQILMDLANQVGGLVIGTGNLSEMALGWSTYGGDHLSMYAINAGLPKTLLREVTAWLADSKQFGAAISETLADILNAPISPELLPPDGAGVIRQKTEDIIGPYELHDFFLYYVLRYGFSPRKIVCLAEHAFAGRYGRSVLIKWLEVFYRRFFASQFKRSCSPDGPQIGSVSLSPRSGWQMPSDAAGTAWLIELDQLK